VGNPIAAAAVPAEMDDQTNRAVKAQVKLADSATQLKDSAQLQLESAERRTVLAADRTVYAAERTYAAWMRTGLAALATGVGARTLLAGVPDWLAGATGSLLIAFSVFCFAAAVWRELVPRAVNPAPDAPRMPAWILIGFTVCLILVACAALVVVWR
jgi:putative membrane protein